MNLVIKFFISFYLINFAHAQRFEQIGTPFEDTVWGLEFINNDEALVTTINGKIFRFNLQNKIKTEISGAPKVWNKGQGGLLDIKLHPEFKQNSIIYLTYSKEVDGGATTALMMAKFDGQKLKEQKDLFVAKGATSKGQHFGSRITFDQGGHLFFGVGDRGERDNAQKLTTHTGTIIRLKLDGSIPQDNPFIGQKDKLPEIWSYGHRNPQGLFFDKPTQKLWEIEHGPRGGDEINLIEKGKNYGWPAISYGKEYWGPVQVGEGTHKAGMEQPHLYYDPSIAPSSLIVYNGSVFKDWKGQIFSSALKLKHVNRVSIDSNGKLKEEKRIGEDLGERIRILTEAPDGLIYLGTDSGKIIVMKP